jgi:hypothetical protein
MERSKSAPEMRWSHDHIRNAATGRSGQMLSQGASRDVGANGGSTVLAKVAMSAEPWLCERLGLSHLELLSRELLPSPNGSLFFPKFTHT